MSGSKGEGKEIEVRQVRSGIGYEFDQKRTLKALGLGRIGRTRRLPDNGATRGMLAKVSHLVEVSEAGSES